MNTDKNGFQKFFTEEKEEDGVPGLELCAWERNLLEAALRTSQRSS
jgi:hypothetical protein